MLLRSCLFFFLAFLISCSAPTFERVETKFEDGSPQKVSIMQGEGDQAVKVGHKEYHPNGQVFMEGNLKGENRNDVWVSYYDDGTPWSESTYKDGKKEGSIKVWFRNGNLRYIGQYTNDEKSGTWTYYDEDGNIVHEQKHGG